MVVLQALIERCSIGSLSSWIADVFAKLKAWGITRVAGEEL